MSINEVARSRSAAVGSVSDAAAGGSARAVGGAARWGRVARMLLLLIALLPRHIAAQQPAPLAVPNLDLRAAGAIAAIVSLPDGSVIVGGYFTSVFDSATQLNFSRGGLAKFNPSGTLDLGWDPLPSGVVNALALDGSSLYVGGAFGSIGGQQRSNIARISVGGNGTADALWNPGVGGSVLALAVDSGNSVVLGGDFSSVAGQPRANIAKVAATGAGALDASWNPSASSYVRALALYAGNVYAGGRFLNIGGAASSGLARIPLSGNGLADAAWMPTLSCNADFGLFFTCVNTIAIDPVTGVHFGGWFNAVNGTSRSSIARVSASGTGVLDGAWNPDANSAVTGIALDGSGGVFAGGAFTTVGGQQREHVVKLIGATSSVDLSWDNPHDGSLYSLALVPGGTLLSGGDFAIVRGELRLGYARLAASGPPAATPLVQSNGEIRELVVGGDGSIFVAGSFQRANNFARRGLLKVRPDGQLDANWNPAITCINGAFCVEGIAVAADGALYAGGSFIQIGGLARNFLAKLSGVNAAADPGWDPSPNSGVRRLALGSDGAVYAYGYFTLIAGASRNNIARFAANGLLDASWVPAGPNAGSFATDLEVDAANNAYLVGTFTSFAGANRNGIAKLVAGNGALDPTWDPAPVGPVFDIELDSTGAVYAAGEFSSIGGLVRDGLAKLSATGTGAANPAWNQPLPGYAFSLAVDNNQRVYAGAYQTLLRLSPIDGAIDPTWTPSVNQAVDRVVIAPSGNVVIAGRFTSVSGQGRQLLAALPAVVDRVFGDGFENGTAN